MSQAEKQTGAGEGAAEPEIPAREEADAAEGESEAAPEAEDAKPGDREDRTRRDDTAVADEMAQLRQENERLKLELREHGEKALRVAAELDNIGKRNARNLENAHKYALEKFINELLPVIDSLELGMDASQSAENIEGLREGMDLTLRKLFDCLDRFGVRAIDPAGEKFDPEWHEAVSMQEIEGGDSGLVVTVMQKGYELNGRLVRPARVVVTK